MVLAEPGAVNQDMIRFTVLDFPLRSTDKIFIKPPSELPGAKPALFGDVFDTLPPGYPFLEPYEAIGGTDIWPGWCKTA